MPPVDTGGPPWPASRWEEAFQHLTKAEQTQISKTLQPGSLLLPNLLSDIEAQIDRCESKDHVLYTRDDGEEVKLQDSLASIAGHITKFKALGDAAISLAPGYASIPWAAVGFILQATVNDVNKFKQMREGVEIVSKTAATFAEIEKMSFKNQSNLKEQLSSAIIDLYISILKYLLGARVYYSKSRTKRWLRSFSEDTNRTSDFLKSIKEHETTANVLSDKVAQEDSLAALESIQAGVGTLHADISPIKESLVGVKARREKLLQHLNAPSTDARLDQARRERFGDTCNWILDTKMFQEWISERPHQAQVLWIQGPPGFGKTILSARVVDYLLDKFPRRVAYFFASDSEKSHDTNAILRSWIAQMIDQSDETIPAAEKILLSGASHADPSSNSRLWPLVTSIAKVLDETTFVVDGFDECSSVDKSIKWRNSKARETFLQDLKESIKGTSARVLVVSRDIPDIRQGLSAFTSSNDAKLYEHQITPEDTTPDIRAYSKEILESTHPNSEQLHARLIDQACNKSDGMFLWTRFLQEEIQSSSCSEDELENIMEEMPLGMDQLYEKELSKIFHKSVLKRDRDRVAAIFRWVLYAVRPLTVAELAEALILESEDKGSVYPKEKLPACWVDGRVDEDFFENVIKRPCGSLVTAQGWDFDTRTVHFVHFSVKEYLLRPHQDPVEWPDFSDPARENMNLGRHCLWYLCFDCFGDRKQGEDLNMTFSRESFEQPVTTLPPPHYFQWRNYPFLVYAAGYWLKHVYLETERPLDVLEYESKLLRSSNWKHWAWEVEITDHCGEDWPLWWNVKRKIMNPSPIYYAALLGLTDVVKCWHVMGFSLDAEGGLYGFPLQAAAHGGSLDIAEYLLRNGTDVNQAGGYYKNALIAAADASSTEMIRLLLSFDADPTQTTKFGRTALHLACYDGLVEDVSMLVEAGSPLSGLDAFNLSPIGNAAIRGHYKVVEFLLGHNADLAYDQPEVFLAAFRAGSMDVARLLLRHSALAPPRKKHEGEVILDAAEAGGEMVDAEGLYGRWHVPSDDAGFSLTLDSSNVEAADNGPIFEGYIDMTSDQLAFGHVSYDQSVRLVLGKEEACEKEIFALYDGIIEAHKGKVAATMTLMKTELAGLGGSCPDQLTFKLTRSVS